MKISAMDGNDLDAALHNIRQMTEVALRATDALLGSDVEPGYFRMLAEDAELLIFALFDLQERIEKLKDWRRSKATVVTLDAS